MSKSHHKNVVSGKPVDMPPRLDSYYVRFRQYALLTALAGQIAVGFLIGGMVWFFLPQLPLDTLLIALLIGFFVLEMFTSLIVISTVLKPTQVFTNALVYVSGENRHVTAPYVNTERDERSGLKSLVQLIYRHDEVKGEPSHNAIDGSILEHLPVGLIALAGDGAVTFATETAPVRMTTAGSREITLQFNHNDDLAIWLQTAQQTKVSDTRSWLGIADRPHGEPGRRIFDVVASFERGASEEFETVVITIDRSAAYMATDEDFDFIALAAHELRGPITVIRGYLDVLEDELSDVLDADRRALFDRLNVSASHLSGYVNNILSVARYDRAHLRLYLRETKLDAIYAAIAGDLTLRANTQNRTLVAHIPGDLPTVAADQSSIGEVITNFIDNAVKYSRDGGSIEVSAAVTGAFVSFSVTDHGVGIAPSAIGSLFGKFYRSHRSRERVAGTGLGLYISKAIVESHGGTITVRSKEGEGATFTFTLPTYQSVADKLQGTGGTNDAIIQSSHGWIKNHNLVRK